MTLEAELGDKLDRDTFTQAPELERRAAWQ